MAWTFLSRTLWLLLLLAVTAATACRQTEPLPISLMEQLDPAEPLGPWRVAAEIRGLDAWAAGAEGLAIPVKGELVDADQLETLTRGQLKHATKVMGKGGAFVQKAPVSVFRQPLAAEDGQLLLGLRYARAWADPPRVEVRLLRQGEMVAATEAEVSGHWCEARLDVPAGGADTLEIRHHLDPGSGLPLRNATILNVTSEAPEEAVSRALLFLRLARDDRPFPVARISERRTFPLSLDGRTLDTMLLSGGETRELAVPAGLAGRQLRSWCTLLDGGTSGSAALSIETASNGGWQPLARQSLKTESIGTWSSIAPADGVALSADCSRVRLSLDGEDAIVGVSGLLLPAGERARGRKNLLVIDLDTLRADRMGTYGYEDRPTTTALDNILEERGGHLFQNAYTPAAFTLPATAKMLASRYHDIQQKSIVPRDYTLLQEMLRQAGYYCAAFTGGGQLRHQGFEQGFHEYHWSRQVGKVEDSFPQATSWLADNAGELFFLFLHTYETHAPYTRGDFCQGLRHGRLGDVNKGELLVPKGKGIRNDTKLSRPERAYVNAAYDSGVKRAAEAVTDLLRELDRLGLSDSTVVVLLSDHGEEFWDHNEIFAMHGQSLYGELLNVPLIILDPDHPTVGLNRITEAASLVDLAPTVLDLLGVPCTTAMDGASLVPLMAGRNTIQRKIPVLASRLDKAYCVVHEGAKYTCDLGPQPWLAPAEIPAWPGELYRLTDDPGEQHNLVAAEPELLQRMRRMLRRAAADALPPLAEEAEDIIADTDPDLQRQLRALGYIGGK